jgi:hypothetical protein
MLYKSTLTEIQAKVAGSAVRDELSAKASNDISRTYQSHTTSHT